MASLNKFLAIGRLTRDVELRVTPKGVQVAQIGLAINRRYKAEDGSQRDEATFLDFEAWGKTAELCAKYLLRGSEVYFEARAKVDSWEDKASGHKRTKVKFVVENVQFLGGGQRDGAGGGEQAASPGSDTPPPRRTPSPQSTSEDLDDDVPF
jgi:single-strand DNA-binding protein